MAHFILSTIFCTARQVLLWLFCPKKNEETTTITITPATPVTATATATATVPAAATDAATTMMMMPDDTNSSVDWPTQQEQQQLKTKNKAKKTKKKNNKKKSKPNMMKMQADAPCHLDKENVPPEGLILAASFGGLRLCSNNQKQVDAVGDEPDDVVHVCDEARVDDGGDDDPNKRSATEPEIDDDLDEDSKQKQRNLFFIGEALEMARLALRTNETPVGCVLVHNGSIIAKGMNATNVTRNGTRHAELMAISALLSVTVDGPGDQASQCHNYPYGQKLVPAHQVDAGILRDCILYVTVEPCVMCASLLRQMGIKKVYFGAVNDKFGGTGGVFSIHANSLPVDANGEAAVSHPLPRQQQSQLPDGSGTLGNSYPPGGGDGGNVERGYEIEGGWGRDEAVALLRRFYVQENGRAPVPRKKEGRAARLAAMMEKDALAREELMMQERGGGDKAADAYLELVEDDCR
ncbi:hypothetical protein L249_1790 [Ophiocordyceps polyrhachis-furcata BCC 54312]|uniref:CMP/dCMP-type deaminase domain-containing protein n=1 Tax=Ophiocordyceps polyrhachis-furcata BCC 54312 TaxID=1330021 RepID=A0A367LRM2_9HYPO|nr:hypothetical protein L249_1790 [Ophiocordyceps polyrhachis-furcata BCC 54312]